jgi:5-methylcytosine-specific restriction endonuclease McrA
MTAKETAERICYGEDCFRCYDCGIKKKYTIPPLTENKICPIAKYNLPENKFNPKDVMDAWANQVELEDLYIVCSECEHAEFDGTFVHRDKCYETHCLDCPVHSCEEGILELEAEAMCS